MKKRNIPTVFICISLLIGLIFVVFPSCKKQAFFAGEDSEIRISADRLSIQLDESVRITIIGYDSDGLYLLDGTRVDLSIENGTLDRTWAELEDGTASITAAANISRGQMKITARSGSAVALPNPLIIRVGEVPDVNQIVASLNPAVLPYTGGRVQIIVTVYDSYFQPMTGVSVILEANAGTLDSRGAPLTTNQAGQVTDYLTTDTQCTVTIYAGDRTKTVTVTLEEEPETNEYPVADFTYSPTDPISGEPVYFNASASYDDDGTIIQYSWDFGDGTTDSGRTTEHKFDIGEFQTKTFTVTLVVVDNQGAHDAASQPITITYK